MYKYLFLVECYNMELKKIFLKNQNFILVSILDIQTDLYTPQSFQFKNQSHPLKRTRQQLVDLASIFQRFEN